MIEAVVEHNVARLRASSQPVATIKAIHSDDKASAEDAGGLEPIPCITCEPCVVLTSNFWVDMDGTGQWCQGYSSGHLLSQL